MKTSGGKRQGTGTRAGRSARGPGVLSEFQRRFAEEFALDGNAAGAYRRAGGAGKNPREVASRLKRRPAVAALIALEQRMRSGEASAEEQRAWMTERLVGLVQRAMRADDAKANLATALRALDLLGKHLDAARDAALPETQDPLADRAIRTQFLADPEARNALETVSQKLAALRERREAA